MQLVFIRHGQTILNANGIIQGSQINARLNETGIKQITNTAFYLKEHFSCDIMLSSPLDRAKESGEIIKKIINFDENIVFLDSLVERSYGIYEGVSIKEFRLIEDCHDSFENDDKLISRISLAVDEIVGIMKSKNRKKAIITVHSQVIKAIFKVANVSFSFSSYINNGEIFVFNFQDNALSFVSRFDPTPTI